MSRLADYYVVVGYDHDKSRTGTKCGKIIQRFPQKDWDDCPFTQGLELFCQPSGWQLYKQRQDPTYFVSVLTDIDAERHYCACLSFMEDVQETVKKRADDDEEADTTLASQNNSTDPSLVPHSKMFAPKCLVLISKLDCFETFRNCLGLIYTVYIENMQVQLETLVGNILGCVQVPPAGGPQVRFSVGAGDRQALQPPLSSTLPATRSTVALLFQQLGISNVITLFCALLTDHKILFHSQSYQRLTDASHAITSLLYPLKYSYVYIPLLPACLFEVLNTPTPFIAGVHSSLKSYFTELLDIIIADLDGGSISIPENVTLSLLPEPIHTRVVTSLTMIIHPDLLQADFAFVSSSAKTSPPELIDKEIRAVFLRLFAELFYAYRSCLTIIRIHPQPFITFHKANFLGQRGLIEDDFTTRVLDSMSFSTFVAERGPPFRVTDLFDEVFATLEETLKSEEENSNKTSKNIKDLALQLYSNENPSSQPYVQKIPRPSEGAHCRIHQPSFPLLNPHTVEEIIDEGIQKHHIKSKLSQIRPAQRRIVPIGPNITSPTDRAQLFVLNARRLEVLRNCINFIFENKISDARKIFPAVLRTLKGKVARLALVDELSFHVQSNRAMLEHQQFDMVVKLLNCALQNESNMDENGVAAAILPLCTSFCRKLCTGIIQFAYTCVQEHAVWGNQGFWEATFYQDVQLQIRQLYLPQYEQHLVVPPADKYNTIAHTRHSPRDRDKSEDGRESRGPGLTPEGKRRSLAHVHGSAHFRPKEISALEIAAEQMRIWNNLSPDEQREMVSNEESIVYSQAIHYANRMVFLRVPLDASRSIKEPPSGIEGESTSSNITNSVAESDSFDAESGFDEQEVSEAGTDVVRFVTRFIDKVCTESSVTDPHIKALHQMIPGVVAMHIETLEAVHSESKRLPPIQKPKILTPTLLPGEEIIMDGLRVYLLPDGREEGAGGAMGGPPLLPAEGAAFLTNYRLIFKGTPCDPLACEQVVCRAFPVSTLVREKKISVQYVAHIDQWLQEGLQLRSVTFQLMKIAFDEEVNAEDVETLRKLINKVRNPPSVMTTFAFQGHHAQPLPGKASKEKNASLKGFAKKTLMKTARKAGLRPKSATSKQKYVLPTPPLLRRENGKANGATVEDGLAVIDEAEITLAIQSDAKSLDRLAERAYCRDYARLRIGSLLSNSGNGRAQNEPFRLSMVNCGYAVCRSYPAVLVVPTAISDDSIRRLVRSNRQYRFPVVSWRHQRTKAVLLRASGFHAKGMMGMFKGHHSNPSTKTKRQVSQGSTVGSEQATSSSVEQEKYFAALVTATPLSGSGVGGGVGGAGGADASMSDSLTSLDSLIMSAATGDGVIPDTPDSMRRFGSNPISRAVTTLRGSGGKVKSIGKRGSLRDKGRVSTGSLQYQLRQHASSTDSDLADLAPQTFSKAVLYVFGEKTQVKGIKVDSFPKCDFIPVDYYEVRHVKSSFKKLMRACAPSSPFNEAERGFLKAVEETEWLPQLQNMMQIAGAIVDLIDVQGSSVMVCLEDGWDFTTQVVSVAQLLLDPYYRTLTGFRALVEKEWLSFGHRFTHRSNQTAANQASGFAPIFLQFLDVVHQIMVQFPLSFEFNQMYLRFLAYHYVSNRFRTFMLDNEFERMEAGWLLYDGKTRPKVEAGLDGEPGYSPKHNAAGMSVWDYIEKHNKRSSIFYNFCYSPSEHDVVLRPYSDIAHLKIWEYFLKEDLAHGPSYDLEVVAKEQKILDEEEEADLAITQNTRRIVNGCYDNIEHVQPDACTHLLQEIHKLEAEMGYLPQKWRAVWEQLEHPTREQLIRQMSFNTQLVRSHGRDVHKRSTIEILVKGKMLGEAAKLFSQPHRFEKFTYTTPAYCDYCSHVLWGLVKTGMRCIDCGYNCHEKCVPHVPKNCSRLRPVSEISDSNTTLSKASISETASVTGVAHTSGSSSAAGRKQSGSSGGSGTLVATLNNASVTPDGDGSDTLTPMSVASPRGGSASPPLVDHSAMFDQLSAHITEHRTHEGYLYKRGALLKGWKQRWFVLDSMKHQLRYYDSSEDSHCKGFIDLAEVVSVAPIHTVQGAPKRAGDGAFFEMKTTRRIYNFLAPDGPAAQDWIDKINHCIQ